MLALNLIKKLKQEIGKKIQVLIKIEKNNGLTQSLFFFFFFFCLAHVQFGKNRGQEILVARLCVPHTETE